MESISSTRGAREARLIDASRFRHQPLSSFGSGSSTAEPLLPRPRSRHHSPPCPFLQQAHQNEAASEIFTAAAPCRRCVGPGEARRGMRLDKASRPSRETPSKQASTRVLHRLNSIAKLRLYSSKQPTRSNHSARITPPFDARTPSISRQRSSLGTADRRPSSISTLGGILQRAAPKLRNRLLR